MSVPIAQRSQENKNNLASAYGVQVDAIRRQYNDEVKGLHADLQAIAKQATSVPTSHVEYIFYNIKDVAGRTFVTRALQQGPYTAVILVATRSSVKVETWSVRIDKFVHPQLFVGPESEKLPRDQAKRALELMTKEAEVASRAATELGVCVAYPRSIVYLDHAKSKAKCSEGRTDSSVLAMTYDYIPGGDMHGLIERSLQYKVSLASESMMASWFRPACEALHALHSAGIAHHDVSINNLILTRERTRMILIDCAFAQQTAWCSEAIGTPEFAAPEMMGVWPDDGKTTLLSFKNCAHDPIRADVWALGISMLMVRRGSYLTDQDPGNRQDFCRELASRTLDPGTFVPFHAPKGTKTSALFIDLLYGMLEPDPSKRLTMKQVLDHTWWKTVETKTPVGLGGLEIRSVDDDIASWLAKHGRKLPAPKRDDSQERKVEASQPKSEASKPAVQEMVLDTDDDRGS